jgi:hypothetical protein
VTSFVTFALISAQERHMAAKQTVSLLFASENEWKCNNQ